MAYERKSRRAMQSRQRAKLSFPDDSVKATGSGKQTPTEGGTPTAEAGARRMAVDLACVPTPVRGRGGPAQLSEALFKAEDVLPSSQQALTYRERLRATGAQALRCVRDAGIANKAAARGQKTNPNTAPKQMPFGSMMRPGAVPPEAASVPPPIDQPLTYAPMCGTAPMAAAQGMHDWGMISPVAGAEMQSMMSPVAGSPQYWPQTPMGCVSPVSPMMEVMQFQEDRHTNLMAIAMPQAVDYAMNNHQIAAQLLAATPVQYED